jgi:micrococcal nuclease|tara:strand:- start:325 stop:693 length:369 start_codon:yes stop_codon:yes gene_type:complete
MYTYKATLDRVIDGDTIDVNIDLGFDISVKKRVRFLGINTPESRTRDLEEKKRGLAAKDRVKSILNENSSFIIESKEVGKFGRVLGEVFINTVDTIESEENISLNELLKNEGHAVEYHGGKR